MNWMLSGIAWADPGRPENAPDHERVANGSLCALMTRTDRPTSGTAVQATGLDDDVERAIRLHDGLLQAYANQQDVMPMRFGMCLAAPANAETVLERYGDACGRWLRDFAGRREYALRVGYVGSMPETADRTDEPAAGGRGYLADRLASRQEAERIRRRTDHFVSRIQIAMEDFGVLKPLPKLPLSKPRRAGWACLIRNDRAEAARNAIEALNAEAQTLSLTVSIAGPHAAFSFATLEISLEDAAR